MTSGYYETELPKAKSKTLNHACFFVSEKTFTQLITFRYDVVNLFLQSSYFNSYRHCRGRDRMVVGFTTAYAIGAYRH